VPLQEKVLKELERILKETFEEFAGICRNLQEKVPMLVYSVTILFGHALKGVYF